MTGVSKQSAVLAHAPWVLPFQRDPGPAATAFGCQAARLPGCQAPRPSGSQAARLSGSTHERESSNVSSPGGKATATATSASNLARQPAAGEEHDGAVYVRRWKRRLGASVPVVEMKGSRWVDQHSMIYEVSRCQVQDAARHGLYCKLEERGLETLCRARVP